MVPETREETYEEDPCEILPTEEELRGYIKNENSCEFLKLLAANYDHFLEGKSFLDLVENKNVGFRPFTSDTATKAVQTSHLC